MSKTPVQYFPTRVQKGMAKGARWTLFPYSMYWRGETELDVDSAVALYGNIHGATCWDLGTHFGIYTVGMAMAVGETGQVVGFEPDPASFRRCRRHVEMNSLHWVKLFNAGASDANGSETIIIDNGVGASTSHFAYEGEKVTSKVPTLTVKTISLDTLANEGQIRPAHFIKVDVEGHGAKALQGARETITDNRPTLAMSFHSPSEIDGTASLLKPLGYRAFTCEGKAIEWQDIYIGGTTVLRPD